MLGSMLRVAAEIGPSASWILKFFAAIFGVLVLYLGIALVAMLLAPDEQRAKLRYKVFHDLLEVFRFWDRK